MEVDTLELPFVYPMQVLSTEGHANWPEEAYRVLMDIEDHDPQIVQVPKCCFRAVMNDEMNTTQYSVIPEQVATIQKIIVSAMGSAARESKNNAQKRSGERLFIPDKTVD